LFKIEKSNIVIRKI